MNEEMREEAGVDGMMELGVWGHRVARPPQAQSGSEAVPDDE